MNLCDMSCRIDLIACLAGWLWHNRGHLNLCDVPCRIDLIAWLAAMVHGEGVRCASD